MDRNSLLRLLFIALGTVAILIWNPCDSHKTADKQPIPEEVYVNAPGFDRDASEQQGLPPPREGEACVINGERFVAELSTRGAAIKHFRFTESKYASSAAADLSTTPDHEQWRSLRTLFRGTTPEEHAKYNQLDFDRFLWTLAKQDGKSCEFTYEAEGKAQIKKTISAGARPYELEVTTSVTNLSDEPKTHRYTIGAYAFRRHSEMSGGSFGRVSPFVTDLQCARGDTVLRKNADDFSKGWHPNPEDDKSFFVDGRAPVDHYAAVSNYYFAQALVPADVDPSQPSAAKPECAILAENFPAANKDDEAKVFHALTNYPARTLNKNESATYHQTAYFGPKERDLLRHAAGGTRGLDDLIDLGFFTPVAKVLVSTLRWLRDHVTLGNWGLAIIALTIVVRTLLFPLTWKSIKATIAMRKLKPEIDELNAKFADDAQAKNLAMMELWRKHKVNPLGGCLPTLVQMPVWFAMYRTLQTAAEMYHTKFLWFQDLSSPDKFFVLPLVLGAVMIVQQKIVPQQGMDPMQQKMMTWLLPIVFTGMMLFLPAALGIYMLTNSILGIVQQLAVEKFAPRGGHPGTKGEIVVKETGAPALKGKARV